VRRGAERQAQVPAEPRFTSDSARDVLEEACRVTGLDAAGATLLRLGENAIFRLSEPSSSVVVRIPRDVSRLPVARRELCVSRWLNEAGVAATRVVDEVPDQPRMVAGHPVTFWRAVDSQPQRPTVVDLAGLLRELHALDDSPCELHQFDPLSTVRPRLERGLDLPAADQDFLAARCKEIAEALSEITPVLPPGPIHGDAHTGNLLGGAGAAVLIDFETFAVGPREWDLVPVTVGHARLGISGADLDEFVAIYGFDVRDWPGYPVLREARELGMTTWLAQNVAESTAIAAEVALRVDSLRNGDLDRAWTPY
jgi:aminoglycoside phosphotransferase (APT) family kinase protein